MPSPLLRICTLLPKKPSLYFLLWAIWFTVLWQLSASTPKITNAPEIPHFDKVLHFGYFFGGGILLTGFLLNQTLFKFQKTSRILLTCLFIGALAGAIDEWHQSYTPGRSGLDPLDWFADCFGSYVGAVVMLKLWSFRVSSNNN